MEEAHSLASRADEDIRFCRLDEAKSRVELADRIVDGIQREHVALHKPIPAEQLGLIGRGYMEDGRQAIYDARAEVALRKSQLAWIRGDFEGAVSAGGGATLISSDPHLARRFSCIAGAAIEEIWDPTEAFMEPDCFNLMLIKEGTPLSLQVVCATRDLACNIRTGRVERADRTRERLEALDIEACREDAALAYRWMAIHSIHMARLEEADEALSLSLSANETLDPDGLSIDHVLAGYVAAHLSLARGAMEIGREQLLTTTERALGVGLIAGTLKAHRYMSHYFEVPEH